MTAHSARSLDRSLCSLTACAPSPGRRRPAQNHCRNCRSGRLADEWQTASHTGSGRWPPSAASLDEARLVSYREHRCRCAADFVRSLLEPSRFRLCLLKEPVQTNSGIDSKQKTFGACWNPVPDEGCGAPEPAGAQACGARAVGRKPPPWPAGSTDTGGACWNRHRRSLLEQTQAEPGTVPVEPSRLRLRLLMYVVQTNSGMNPKLVGG